MALSGIFGKQLDSIPELSENIIVYWVFTAFLNLSGNSSCLEEAAAAVAERFPGPMKCRHSWRVWALLMTQSEHWTHWMNKLFHDINCA